MGAVAITMDAVKKKADVRTMTFQKKLWTSKLWHGGTPIAGEMRKGNLKWRITKMIQKSELQQVPVEQRVQGRVYGVSDDLEGELFLVKIYHSDSNDIDECHWKYWFAIPESMLPVREVMPDEFELKHVEWELINLHNGTRYRKRKPILMPLTIPSGSKSEQIAELEKILAELKQS